MTQQINVVNANDFDERAIDANGSSAASSEMSTAVNERKILIWLKHKKRNYSLWMFTCSIVAAVITFLASWLIFEELANFNFAFGNSALQANKVMSNIFMKLSDSLTFYYQTSSVRYCQANSCVTETQLSSIKDLVYTAKALEPSYQQDLLLNETAQAIDSLKTQLLDTDGLYGSDLNLWLKDASRDFDTKIGGSSYSSLANAKTMPTLGYVESVYSILVRLAWMIELQNLSKLDTKALDGSDQFVEFKYSVINDGVPLVLAKVYALAESLFPYLESSKYTTYIMVLLCATGVTLGLCYLFQLYSLWSVQTYLNYAVEAYALLREVDLVFELDKLENCRRYFEAKNQFAEREQINRAVAAYADSNGKKNDKSVQQYNINKKSASIFSREISEQNSKKVKKINRSQSTKFKSTRLFRGVKRSLILASILLVLVIVTVPILVAVNSLAKSSNTIKSLVTKCTAMHLKLQLDYSALNLYSPYAISELRSRWKDVSTLAASYRTDQQTLVEFWNVWRPTLRSLLGSGNTIETVLYGNMCQEVRAYNKLAANWTACSKLNQNIGHKGLIAYTFLESSVFEDIYRRLSPVLNLSVQTPPAAIGTDALSQLAQQYFADQYLEIRASHSSIFGESLKILIGYAETQSSIKESQVRNLLASLRIAGLAVVILPLLILALRTGRHLQEDHRVSLYTFETVSPSILMGNQYLLTKFKFFFKTTIF